jgi:hypothetical protein
MIHFQWMFVEDLTRLHGHLETCASLPESVVKVPMLVLSLKVIVLLWVF